MRIVRNPEATGVRLWALLFALLVSAGCNDDASLISLSRKEILELQSKVEALETANKCLAADLKKLSKELASLPKQAPTEPLACLEIAADTYQEIGTLWQVTKLRVVSHPQGTELRGELLSRLMLNRNNMTVEAWFPGDSQRSRGVARSIRGGGYSDFSVVIRTKADLRDTSTVCIALDENTGTTSAAR